MPARLLPRTVTNSTPIPTSTTRTRGNNESHRIRIRIARDVSSCNIDGTQLTRSQFEAAVKTLFLIDCMISTGYEQLVLDHHGADTIRDTRRLQDIDIFKGIWATRC